MAPFLPSLMSGPRIRRRHLRKYSWLPDVLRIKGSVIPRIIGPVLTVTIWAVIIAVLFEKGYPVSLTNSVTPLLSVVVGLILVFRNGTSYDRYWEGRKSFASVTSHLRNLSRLIWVNVAPQPANSLSAAAKGKEPEYSISPAQLKKQKVDALVLCTLFAYSIKHYLRGEDGLDWEDYTGLVPSWFNRIVEGPMNGSYYSTKPNSMAASYMTTDSSQSAPGTPKPPRNDATKRIRPKRSRNKMLNPETPLLGQTTVDFGMDTAGGSMPLPLIISHELYRMIYSFRREGFLETVGPAGTNAMSALVQGIVDQLTAMERVANTPIPASYSIHLKQCVTLYLFSLPLTLIKDLGWSSIVIVTVVAFTLMGIEGIADEIEMPFGDDAQDLPLDRYCRDLREEIQYIISYLPDSGEGIAGYDDGEGDD